MSEEEEKKEKKIFMFYLDGNNIAIRPSSVKRIIKHQGVDAFDTDCFFLSVIDYEPEHNLILKFYDERVRDVEHLNLISKFEELGINFI